ncbi:MAG: ATP-binding protein [Actinomycetota bacterium]
MPIRARLSIAFAAAMALLLAAIGAFVYLRLGAELLETIDTRLRAQAVALEAGIETDEGVVGELDLEGATATAAQVVDDSGRVLESTDVTSPVPLVNPSDLSTAGPAFIDRRLAGSDDTARIFILPVEESSSPLFVVVGSSLEERDSALESLLLLLVLGGPALLAVSALGAWFLAGAALRPVERMRREAAAVSASEPGRRLPVPGSHDEVARLGETLNSLLDRLEEALGRERRFVDDASHELRTPLGILKAELDLALSRARSTEELEAALRSASEEADRLVSLAEDLLVLSRARGGKLPVHRTEWKLDETIAEACGPFRIKAERAGVTIEVSAEPISVRLDGARVRQVIENLLSNALRHAPAGGRIEVSASRESGSIRLACEDSGGGFPPEFVARAFDPFARGENEPTGSAGAGLGLAIVRAVAEAHGGSASVENLPGGGARVTVLLPAEDENASNPRLTLP